MQSRTYKKKPNGKNAVGRPAYYKTVEELEAKISEYFNGGYRTRTVNRFDKKGNLIETIQVPMVTITGLVIFLGFADKKSFYELEEDRLFSHSIKRARTFIEREYEEKLDINPTGAIFALKNFKRTDKVELEHTGKDGGAIEMVDLTNLTPKQLEERRRILLNGTKEGA